MRPRSPQTLLIQLSVQVNLIYGVHADYYTCNLSRIGNEAWLIGRSCIYIERSSNGNLVNVGNCDSDGVNVNNDKPDNSNSNLGVRFFRSVHGRLLKGAFCVFGMLDPTAEHFSDFK